MFGIHLHRCVSAVAMQPRLLCRLALIFLILFLGVGWVSARTQGSLDAGGRLWASVLPGLPGFIKSPSDTTLQIRAPVSPSDPLHESLKPGAPVGLLGIELATRRRNRANGKITQVHDQGRGGFDFKVDVSFGNCPKVRWPWHEHGSLAERESHFFSCPVYSNA